jgi:poly-gamma-glutamate synthesis protein (capsule biosynthesis protein)
MRRRPWWLPVAVLLMVAAPAGASDTSEPRSFTIAAGGDVIVHIGTARVAENNAPGWGTYNFTPLLSAVEPWISEADLAICQMEMTLTDTNRRLTYWPRFVVPYEIADAMAAIGFDACSTASNHALDAGRQGLADTIGFLQAAGLATTGTARTEEERLPNLYDANGVTVGHMAYTYGLNGWHTMDPWSINFIDIDVILADARWAHEHGAEFVILSMHWGYEYRVRPTSQQISLAEQLLASPDIDLILGHHVHVVQPIQRIGDKYVVYGMSNLLASIRSNDDKGRFGTEDGIIINAEVVEQADGRFVVERLEYTPIWVDVPTKEVFPVGHSLLTGRGNPATLLASWQRSVARVEFLGPSGATPTEDPWPAVSCNGEVATILGTPGDDLLIGTEGDDVIVARGGDDSIWSGGGDDLVCGGDGDDFISGGQGDDRLEGDGGNDLLMGYDGADVLWGGDGNDLLSGLDGDDLLVGGSGDDSLLGGGGDDLLWGGDGANRGDGGPGADYCAAVISGCG